VNVPEAVSLDIVDQEQLCQTQMPYWAKNHVAMLTRAAHLMTY